MWGQSPRGNTSDTRGYSVRKLDDGVYVVTGMALVIR